MARVALVAGASSGLGRAVARRLVLDGYTVYAGARSFAKDATAAPYGSIPLALDVTDGASVSMAVGRVLAAEGRVDALVNCAAILTLGSCEETGVDELRAVLETNFLGMVRMTQAVLPGMRARGEGRIVQFSSINGLLAIPFQGAYTASKHAVEGFSEALSLEVGGFGVKVTLVEPGDCRGGSDAYRKRTAAAGDGGSPYREAYEAAVRAIARDEAQGMPPDRVAAAVSRLLSKKRPPKRLLVARMDQRLAVWLHDLVPGRLFERIIGGYYGARRAADPSGREGPKRIH